MSLATATKVPGTIPNEFADTRGERTVRIGHPKGTIAINADVSGGKSPRVEGGTYWRTVCPVFAGEVYYRYVGGLASLR